MSNEIMEAMMMAAAEVERLRQENSRLRQAQNLQWQTDAPTKEGWYWAVPKNEILKNACVGGVEIVYLFEDPDTRLLLGLMINSKGEIAPTLEFTHWLGPLPLPDPPKE